MTRLRCGAGLAAFALLVALLTSVPPQRTLASGCEDLRSEVEATTAIYLGQKSAYEKVVKGFKSYDAHVEKIRAEQTRYFTDRGTTSPNLDKQLRVAMVMRDLFEGEIAPKHRQALRTYRQLQEAKAALKACQSRPATPIPSTTEEWAGTYVNTSGSYKLEIAGSGATFTAETTWTGSGNQGGNNTLNCTAHGSTATCEGSGSYFDDDKTVTTTMETTLRKSGSTIRETDKILTASCAPKKVADCKDLGYTPAVRAGAEFTNNVRKP